VHEGKIMPKLSLTDVMLTAIERPRCLRCQTRMRLATITALPEGAEKRMFECEKCDFIETRTVSDPLKSDAVERLTHNIRPPN
jgi:exosome complex RNA-binding protein Csl4